MEVMHNTEKKNQHYVPKLLLRYFSYANNSRQIGVYNLKNGKFLERVPLKHQASKAFFYGKDGNVEDWLCEIEGMTAPILKMIVETKSLELRNEEIQLLMLFILLLSNRTQEAAENTQKTAETIFQQLLKYDPRLKDVPKDLHVKLSNPVVHSIDAVLRKVQTIFDLKAKLIINETNHPFICSDNPVVTCNQFLERRKHKSSHIGLQSKGLQMFLPITPNYLIVLYDEWAYKIGDRRKKEVHIKTVEDVNWLNYLQMINCHEQIFFNEEFSKSQLSSFIHLAINYRKVEKKTIEEYGSLNDFDKNVRIHSYRESQNINLVLSFINETKKAKNYILSDYILQLRNEKFRPDRIDNYMKLSSMKPLSEFKQ